ncbi:Uroporphyrinogen decarboxylase [Sporomusa silvacetica DSM 10669]|uniref:Uroporphyrinogen decarboxylase n=1 Tax=Sporomusa silvacetica DSM 10669 TaxID=1123289 RepID=A0ABZ3IHT0_9FIRM|nr:uroporphyrinogen decarboxylase family protein [Sporomusa silvacetica]OZC14888.1 uroporphyrinogen decarboxylase [Sporomusa silvacetica DSM 10669]
MNSAIHSDIVWPGSGYNNLLAHIFGGKIKFRAKGNIDVIRPAFQSLAELDKFDVGILDKHPWIITIRDIIKQVDSLVGQNVLVGTSVWGPFTLAGQFYGVEKLMSGLYKDKAAIHALLEVMTEICYRYLSPTIEKGALLLSIAEPTASGDLISLQHFEDFVVPYLTKLVSRLKQDGALITLHICGNIRDRLALAPAIGVDLLSVDSKVDLDVAIKTLDGRVALAGNLNPVMLKDCPANGLITATEKILQEASGYSRYILMLGCDIPPTVPLYNVQTFLSTGLNWVG